MSTHDPHGSSEHPPVVDEKDYWLDKPENIKKVIHGFYAVCALVFLADVVHQLVLPEARHHQAPESIQWIEDLPGFYAVYGLVACTVLVYLAKYLLRPVVMRDEDYYD